MRRVWLKSLHDWVKHQFETTGDKSGNVVENNSAGKKKVGEAGQESIYSMYDSAGENYLRLFNMALYIALGEKPFTDFGGLINLQWENGLKNLTGKTQGVRCLYVTLQILFEKI